METAWRLRVEPRWGNIALGDIRPTAVQQWITDLGHEDAIIPPAKGRYIAEHIPDAKYVELPGRNFYHSVEPGWRASFQEIAEFLTGHQPDLADDRVLATVLSPTSWIRRAAPRRSVTVTGTPCSMRTTPS